MKKRAEAGVEKWLRIGELSRQTGASVDLLRHYERRGLIAPARLPNGYRVYTRAHVARVRTIRAALALGFGLDELSAIFRLRASGGAPCREVRALAAGKLTELRTLIAQLSALGDRLEAALADWDRRLEKHDGNRPAHLLEALAEAGFADLGPAAAHRKLALRRPKNEERRKKT